MKQYSIRHMVAILGCACLLVTTSKAVENPTKAIPNGEKQKISGIIQGRSGETVRVRTDDNSVVVVDLTDSTKIQLKGSGLFRRGKKAMDVTSLVPGLRVDAEGKGNEQGQLVADRVAFDPTSYRASRGLDTRVSPLEGRADSLEGRAGQLEGRAGKLEGRAGDLETKAGQLSDQQKQDEQQIGSVKGDADKANQGVMGLNGRVDSLDDYTETAKATVYFKINSAILSEEARKDLDDLISKTKSLKAYMVEVVGFTDTTGKATTNELLSEKRANAVVHYLQMNDVPLRRILAPAGLGQTHNVADNTTTEGRKLNRRVEVKVVVNNAIVKGATAMNQSASPATAQPVQ